MAYQGRSALQQTNNRGALNAAMDQGYYISWRWRQQGPYTKEQLRAMRIKRGTLIWDPDRWIWVPVEAVDALVDLFRSRGPIARLTALWTRLFPARTPGNPRTLAGI